MRYCTALAVAAGTLAVLAPSPVLSAPADLDLKRLTLYRSGVGYFEWRGVVDGDAEVELRFSQEQINDILKSMVLLDLGGGRIEAVEYNSKEPLERRLASFAVDISDNPSRAELLNRLRGASVRVTATEGDILGKVVGVETSIGAINQYTGEEQLVHTLHLSTNGGIESVPLDEVARFQIMDEELSAELRRALAALDEQRSETVQTIDLRFRGDNARQVVVGYVHETPVWKTSYRLILPEDDSGNATLQGWAIVENTTDEDWENVTLSLVSGRPVGFTMDLAEPLYLPRPEVPVPVEAGVRPRTYAAGQGGGGGGQSPFQSSFDAEPESRQRSMARGIAPAAPAPAMEMMTESLAADAYTKYAAQAQASAGEVGEVFQYTLDAPVTIDRRRSAMLPILSAAVEGRRVSIYNRADNPEHPMRGVEITNTSDLQLMPGPISVVDGSAYAGDAQIGHVSAGGERLLAYAVDLDVTVTPEVEFDGDVVGVSIVDGVLVRREGREQTETYAIRNADKSRGRKVIIETAKLAGWDLVSPQEASEETPTSLRFEREVDAGGKADLVITRRTTTRQTVALINADINDMLALSRDGKVSKAVLDAVREAQRIQARVRSAEQRGRELERERNEITAEQTRIRSNMGAIDRTSDLYRRYLTKLDEQESRLERLEEGLREARADQAAAAADLAAYLRGLTVE